MEVGPAARPATVAVTAAVGAADMRPAEAVAVEGTRVGVVVVADIGKIQPARQESPTSRKGREKWGTRRD